MIARLERIFVVGRGCSVWPANSLELSVNWSSESLPLPYKWFTFIFPRLHPPPRTLPCTILGTSNFAAVYLTYWGKWGTSISTFSHSHFFKKLNHSSVRNGEMDHEFLKHHMIDTAI